MERRSISLEPFADLIISLVLKLLALSLRRVFITQDLECYEVSLFGPNHFESIVARLLLIESYRLTVPLCKLKLLYKDLVLLCNSYEERERAVEAARV